MISIYISISNIGCKCCKNSIVDIKSEIKNVCRMPGPKQIAITLFAAPNSFYFKRIWLSSRKCILARKCWLRLFNKAALRING